MENAEESGKSPQEGEETMDKESTKVVEDEAMEVEAKTSKEDATTEDKTKEEDSEEPTKKRMKKEEEPEEVSKEDRNSEETSREDNVESEEKVQGKEAPTEESKTTSQDVKEEKPDPPTVMEEGAEKMPLKKEPVEEDTPPEEGQEEGESQGAVIKTEPPKTPPPATKEEPLEAPAALDDDDAAPESPINVDAISSLKTLGPFIAARDNSRNLVYASEVPDICKAQPCVLGVDEAGRGPVLGPMVYGIAYCPIEKKELLETLGCADSKQLTEERREAIFEEINQSPEAQANIGWAVELISPSVISQSMNRRSKCSLNELSMSSAIALIHGAIEGGVNVAEIYVDTVGPPEKYQAKLKEIFTGIEVTVAKKADSTFPIVSAASICAKVTRDHALRVWRFPEDIGVPSKDFGSGYPGDPVTKRFLSEQTDIVFGFPRLVRFSWSTAEVVLQSKAYTMEFDEPESEKPKKYTGAKITQFYKNSSGEIKRQTCRFYRERFLDNVTQF